jgi:hypothetical protein
MMATVANEGYFTPHAKKKLKVINQNSTTKHVTIDKKSITNQ